MKVRTAFNKTKSERTTNWAFFITPAIYLARQDVFASESCHCFVIQWLMFQFVISLTKRKVDS